MGGGRAQPNLASLVWPGDILCCPPRALYLAPSFRIQEHSGRETFRDQRAAAFLPGAVLQAKCRGAHGVVTKDPMAKTRNAQTPQLSTHLSQQCLLFFPVECVFLEGKSCLWRRGEWKMVVAASRGCVRPLRPSRLPKGQRACRALAVASECAMKTVEVDLGDRTYPIYIGPKLLDTPELLTDHIRGKRVLVVTNETIAPLYLARCCSSRAVGGRKVGVADSQSLSSISETTPDHTSTGAR